MPQMKPLNWMMLFITMNLILMFMNIMNFFFIYINKKIIENKQKKTFNLNWKW